MVDSAALDFQLLIGCPGIGLAVEALIELLEHIDVDDLVNVVSHPDLNIPPPPG